MFLNWENRSARLQIRCIQNMDLGRVKLTCRLCTHNHHVHHHLFTVMVMITIMIMIMIIMIAITSSAPIPWHPSPSSRHVPTCDKWLHDTCDVWKDCDRETIIVTWNILCLKRSWLMNLSKLWHMWCSKRLWLINLGLLQLYHDDTLSEIFLSPQCFMRRNKLYIFL